MSVACRPASLRVRVTAVVTALVAVPVTVGAAIAVESIDRSIRQDTRADTEDLAASIQEEVIADGFFDPSELADGKVAGVEVFLRDDDGSLLTVSGESAGEPVGDFVVLDGIDAEFLAANVAFGLYDQCVGDAVTDEGRDPAAVWDSERASDLKVLVRAEESCVHLLPEIEAEIDAAYEAVDDCLFEAFDRFGGFEEAHRQAEEECWSELPDESLEGFETVAFPLITSSGALSATTAGSLEDAERAVREVRQATWVAIPSLVALIAITTWVTTGRALGAVGRITNQVRRISESTLHERVTRPGTGDEIDRLAVTMNDMLERLEDGTRRQRVFVSDASHELRTPVATIRTEVEVALAHPEAADWPAVATVVLAEDERLERLVADLLYLARQDERSVGVVPESSRSGSVVDVEDVVRSEAARRRRVAVEVSTVGRDGRIPPVVGRREDLRRMVGHLLDNAARHARGTVQATLQHDGSELVLWIDDDGEGIAEEYRRTVFDRFGRLDEGRARDTGGAGLGLAVASEVASRHGGTIEVVDAALGGARFEVHLPVVDD